jgi:hypothetical protein
MKYNKQFIQGTDISVVILDLSHDGIGRVSLSSGFLKCLALEEWVKKRPNIFSIEQGDTRTTYSGVFWEGDVKHGCSEEMTSCIGEVYFTYEQEIKLCRH